MYTNTSKILVLIPLILLTIAKFSFAQQAQVKQAFTYDQKELWFDKIVTLKNTNLINGPEYFIPFQATTTHPFFGSRELTNEELAYDHQRYVNVPILYDIFGDILILRLQDKNGLFAMVQINEDKVESFSLYHHHFRKLTNPKESETGSGYYDVLYEGKNIMLVAKRGKSKYILNDRVEFQLEEKFYFIRNNEWSRLSGTGSCYKLMKANKSRITSFIKSQKIKVRKQNEQDIIAIAAFCNSLPETVLK
ncbi:MAG: hypothetical protein ABI663_09590 [Chryseolinea sp.]